MPAHTNGIYKRFIFLLGNSWEQPDTFFKEISGYKEEYSQMILVDKNFPKRRVYAMPYHYADDSNSLYNRECRVMFILENHTVYRNSLCPCIFRSSIIPIFAYFLH